MANILKHDFPLYSMFKSTVKVNPLALAPFGFLNFIVSISCFWLLYLINLRLLGICMTVPLSFVYFHSKRSVEKCLQHMNILCLSSDCKVSSKHYIC